MRKILLACVIAAVPACDDPAQLVFRPDPVAMGVQPGTRLQPKLQLADDGTVFLHPTIWKDAEFGECVFRTAADGEYRCLPNAPVQFARYFLDPSCIQEVFVLLNDSSCQPLGTYGLIQGSGTTCAQGASRVVTVDKHVEVNTVYALLTSASCNKVGIDSNDNVYLIGAEIPAADFVSAWR